MKNLAIIPARSGSKGVPDKNIRLINGKPLLAYTIETAIKCKMFDEVFVSTDSKKYAEIANKFGANVPFFRSSETSSDNADSWSVVRETLEKYRELNKSFTTIALLQPTSPLREPVDIVNGYELYKKKEANSIVSVCEVEYSPLLCNLLGEDLSMKNFLQKDVYLKPRQKLPVYYRINGALYIVKVKDTTNIFDLYDEKCYAYIMSREKSIDIDTELDFCIAEKIQNDLCFKR